MRKATRHGVASLLLLASHAPRVEPDREQQRPWVARLIGIVRGLLVPRRAFVATHRNFSDVRIRVRRVRRLRQGVAAPAAQHVLVDAQRYRERTTGVRLRSPLLDRATVLASDLQLSSESFGVSASKVLGEKGGSVTDISVCSVAPFTRSAKRGAPRRSATSFH